MAVNGKYVTAVILAAGSGSRMMTDIPKQNIVLCGKSVLARALCAFEKSSLVDSIVLVVRDENTESVKRDFGADFVKLSSVISGGDTRAASAKAGFCAIPDKTDIVAFHDAARCLVTVEDIDKVIRRASETGAATASAGVTDTVKLVDGDIIKETLDRERLRFAQTPQAFSVDIYRKGLVALGEDFTRTTDDNMIAEAAGAKVTAVETSRYNIKITTKDDILYAEFILSRRGER